jgi:hypothetical protein
VHEEFETLKMKLLYTFQEKRIQCGSLQGMKTVNKQDYAIELSDGLHSVRITNEQVGLRRDRSSFHETELELLERNAFFTRFVGSSSAELAVSQLAKLPLICTSIDQLVKELGGIAIDFTKTSNSENLYHFDEKCNRLQQLWDQTVMKKNFSDDSQILFSTSTHELFEFHPSSFQNLQHSSNYFAVFHDLLQL